MTCLVDPSIEMARSQPASLSFPELRDRLKARVNNPKNTDDLDPHEILHFLASLPVSSHTPDSVDALVQLSETFVFTEQPNEGLQSALLASQMAIAINDRLLLCCARNKEGFWLARVGRLSEAAVARAEAWSLARELGDKRLELGAVWGFSTISVARGQWRTAIHYCERMRELADEIGSARHEFIARNNLADCALQLRDPVTALRALSKLATDAPRTDIAAGTHVHLNINLARSWLLMGDVTTANSYAKKAADWAATWGVPSVAECASALQGLLDVRSGMVDRGLAAVKHALAFARRINNSEVPDCLGICIDAHEDAGRFDEALVYLHELVEWKKNSVDAEVLGWELHGVPELAQPQSGTSHLDDALLAKVHSLGVGVQSRIERLLEIALNAEIASGHDLYRAFRVANLSRHLALSLAWDQKRIAALVVGAQLCNIGMIATPVRILVKRGQLSEGESQVLRGHAEYGAGLLRRSNLQIVETAAVIAEQHHEHYDGRGYPRGMSGQAISEEARIVAICDAFDAMTHKHASGRTPLSTEAALNELLQGANRQFDPRLVNAFVEFVRREFSQHEDIDAFLGEGADEVEYVRVRARMEASIVGRDELREQAA